MINKKAEHVEHVVKHVLEMLKICLKTCLKTCETAVNRLKKDLKSKSRSYQSKVQKQEEIKRKKRYGIIFSSKFKHKGRRREPPTPFVFEF